MSLSKEQFKATSTKKLKTLKDEEDKMLGSNNRDGLADLEIKDGMNKIRIAPKFPGEEEFYHIMKQYWVPFEKEDGTMTKIPVWDSIIHGGTKKDIVDEYNKFVKATLDPEEDADKLKKLNDWKLGLPAAIQWKAYGWKLVKGEAPLFGGFKFKRTVRDELCSLSIIEDEDEAIDVDPFTDIEEGKPILLTYDSKAKKSSDYYNLKLAKAAYPITDEMFEELAAQEPVSKTLRGVYNLEMFEKALEGLRLYDVDNEIDLIDSDDFKEIIAEVRSQYGGASSTKKSSKSKVEDDEDEDEEEDPKPKKTSKPSKPAKKVVEEDEDDEEEEEEDEKPAPKKSTPAAKSKPAAKKTVVEEDDEEEEEEAPKPKKSASKAKVVEEEDEDKEEEEAPKPAKKSSKKVVEEEDDEEEEEKPVKKEKLSIEQLRDKLAARKKG